MSEGSSSPDNRELRVDDAHVGAKVTNAFIEAFEEHGPLIRKKKPRGSIKAMGRIERKVVGWRSRVSKGVGDELQTELRSARYDELTGLPNRRSIYERLKGEITRSRRSKEPVTVVLIDLDGFKQVNDTYGHSEGDKVLQRVSKAWSEHLKRETDYLGRYGGDEFVVILPGPDKEKAMSMAEEMRGVVKAAFAGDEDDRFKGVSASFGLAQVGEKETASAVLVRADEAMYQVKKAEKDGVGFSNLDGGIELLSEK
jgi:diguanylate cyclase (GGDEF)-like protein